jgi:hypothetical protein
VSSVGIAIEDAASALPSPSPSPSPSLAVAGGSANTSDADALLLLPPLFLLLRRTSIVRRCDDFIVELPNLFVGVVACGNGDAFSSSPTPPPTTPPPPPPLCVRFADNGAGSGDTTSPFLPSTRGLQKFVPVLYMLMCVCMLS